MTTAPVASRPSTAPIEPGVRRDRATPGEFSAIFDQQLDLAIPKPEHADEEPPGAAEADEATGDETQAEQDTPSEGDEDTAADGEEDRAAPASGAPARPDESAEEPATRAEAKGAAIAGDSGRAGETRPPMAEGDGLDERVSVELKRAARVDLASLARDRLRTQTDPGVAARSREIQEQKAESAPVAPERAPQGAVRAPNADPEKISTPSAEKPTAHETPKKQPTPVPPGAPAPADAARTIADTGPRGSERGVPPVVAVDPKPATATERVPDQGQGASGLQSLIGKGSLTLRAVETVSRTQSAGPPAIDGGASRTGGMETAGQIGKKGAAGLRRDAEPPALAQVSRGLASLLKKEGGSLTLRLSPDALGSVQIEMRVGDGKADAVLRAETPEARGLLMKHLGSLRATLEARGLSVERLHVEEPRPEGRNASGDGSPGGDPSETGEQNGRGGDGRDAQGRRDPREHTGQRTGPDPAGHGPDTGPGGTPGDARAEAQDNAAIGLDTTA